MLTLAISLNKKGSSYDAILTAEDGSKVLHTEEWGNFKISNKLTRRLKVINLGGKNLGICLNVLNNKTKTKEKNFDKKKTAKAVKKKASVLRKSKK